MKYIPDFCVVVDFLFFVLVLILYHMPIKIVEIKIEMRTAKIIEAGCGSMVGSAGAIKIDVGYKVIFIQYTQNCFV